MQKALPTVAVLAMLALAGCGDKHDAAEPVACPDGTMLTAEQVEALEGHHDAGFNATAACPVPPKVLLSGVPASLQAFKPGPFSWTVDNGSIPHGHSMLTSIRYSTTSVATSGLKAMEDYPKELIKREHQDLPVTFRGNLTFSDTGVYFLRAYAQVQGEGHERRDVWSDEVVLNVTAVAPTGTVHDFTIPPLAGPGGGVDPAEKIVVLGDAIRVVNEDADPRGHSCVRTSGPAETSPVGDGEGAQESIVMVVPGTYEYECDTLQATTFKVIVNA